MAQPSSPVTHPHLLLSLVHWQDPQHLVRRIDAYKRDRQARIAEARAAHEYSELLDCTFTPAITRKVPQPTGPVVVRGLERYMQLQVSQKGQEGPKSRQHTHASITGSDSHFPLISQHLLPIAQSMTFFDLWSFNDILCMVSIQLFFLPISQ